MAFRIQNPVSSLFWEVDDGYRIRLGDKGSVYTHEENGSIVNVDTGMSLRVAGNKIVEGDWASFWTIEDGVISIDAEHIAQYDETSTSMRVASAPASWVLVPIGGAPVPEAESVPEAEEVPETEPVTEVEEVPEAEPVPEAEEVPEAEPVPEAAEVPEAEPDAQAADEVKDIE